MPRCFEMLTFILKVEEGIKRPQDRRLAATVLAYESKLRSHSDLSFPNTPELLKAHFD